jgi:hypothetical protein
MSALKRIPDGDDKHTIDHSCRQRFVLPRHRSSGPWMLGGRGGLMIAAVVAPVAATALAVGQHWLALTDLVPLLFALPCAVMMFMCMKGHHKMQTNASPISTQSGTPRI